MNLIFHLVASLSLVVLVWILYRIQSQRDILRQTLNMAMPVSSKIKLRRISVDWPQKFMTKFCDSLDIPLEINCKSSDKSPKKIDREAIVGFMVRCGIKCVSISDGSNSNNSESELEQAAVITVVDVSKVKKSDETELSHATGFRVTITA